MKRPIILILISFIFGILFYEYFQINYKLIMILLFITIIFYIKFSINSIISIIFIFFGIIITYLSYPADFKLNDNKEFIVRIISNKNFNEIYRYEVKVEEMNNYKVNFNSFLFSKENFEIGDRLNIIGNFKEINNINIKNIFKTKKIFFEIKVNKIKKFGKYISFRDRVKKYISYIFESNLSKTTSNFMKSMILNISTEDNLFENFRKLGLAHILAISGVHVSTLIIFLDFLGIFLGIEKRYFGIFNILVIGFYGYILNFPVSLLRVLIMYIMTYIEIYTYKIRDNINNILVSMFFILIINPFYIYSVGFYLSFTAVFSIFYISPKLKKKFSFIPEFLLVSISIQIGTFPIIMYYFNAINISSLLANLIIIPIMSYSLILGFIYIFIHFEFISIILNVIFNIIEILISGIINIFGNYNLTFYFNFMDILIYYFLLWIILDYRIIVYKSKKIIEKYCKKQVNDKSS